LGINKTFIDNNEQHIHGILAAVSVFNLLATWQEHSTNAMRGTIDAWPVSKGDSLTIHSHTT
jgi:hypothetical protein